MNAVIFCTSFLVAPQVTRFVKTLHPTISKIQERIVPQWLRQKGDEVLAELEALLDKRTVRVVLPDNLLLATILSCSQLFPVFSKTPPSNILLFNVILMAAKVTGVALYSWMLAHGFHGLRTWLAAELPSSLASIVGPSDSSDPSSSGAPILRQ